MRIMCLGAEPASNLRRKLICVVCATARRKQSLNVAAPAVRYDNVTNKSKAGAIRVSKLATLNDLEPRNDRRRALSLW